jgi:Transposase and inactivated derivatives
MDGKTDRYRRGAHTVLELKYHFVWKTKYGYPVLTSEVGLRVRALLKEICASKGLTVERGNVRSNHVHMLIGAPNDLSVSKIAQYLKGKSSYRLLREFPHLKKRYWGSHFWSRGYFCCTVGAVTEEMIKRYIDEQDDVPDGFQVWDEAAQRDLSPPPAFRPISKPSSLDEGG